MPHKYELMEKSIKYFRNSNPIQILDRVLDPDTPIKSIENYGNFEDGRVLVNVCFEDGVDRYYIGIIEEESRHFSLELLNGDNILYMPTRGVI